MARTVLLVDDHPGFRRMAWLLQSGGYVVVGEAGTAAAAVDSARGLEPDLVLLAVLLPDGNGADIADRQLALLPHPPRVVLTSSYERGGLGGRLDDTPCSPSRPRTS